MIEKNDSVISIHKAESHKDIIFVQDCMKEEGFERFIHNIDTKCQDYYIFMYKDRYLGIFDMIYKGIFVVRMYAPNVYIKKRRMSVLCISAMIGWICKNQKWEKILFLVYEGNVACLEVMKRMQIHMEGVRRDSIDKEKPNTYIYSILPEEIEDLKKRYNDLLGD